MGEAFQRLDRLAHAQHEHERGVGGQLHIDVIRGAQLGGELVAGGAGPADVDHDPQGVPAGDSGTTDHLLADDGAARNGLDRLAGPR